MLNISAWFSNDLIDEEVYLDDYPKDGPTEHLDLMGDILILERSDLPALDSLVEKLSEQDPEEAYTLMVEAIRDFVCDHPEQQEFVFEGEY